MDTEEIKQIHTMKEIVESVGLTINRNGFCKCPFHLGDNTASLKIYKDSFYCFGCGKSGDIFSFLQEYHNITFKEAYRILGGTYDRDKKESISYSTLLKIEKARIERKRNEYVKKQYKSKLNNLILTIDAMRKLISSVLPYSEEWCFYYYELLYWLYRYELETGGEQTRGSWYIDARRLHR